MSDEAKPLVSYANINFIRAGVFLVIGTNYPEIKKKFTSLMRRVNPQREHSHLLDIWNDVKRGSSVYGAYRVCRGSTTRNAPKG